MAYNSGDDSEFDGDGDFSDFSGDPSIAALMAKLDKIEQATAKLHEQNSEMRLERSFLRERNDTTVRECSTMAGGEGAHLSQEAARHLSPDEARLFASAMRATADGGEEDDDGLVDLRKAEREMQEQSEEIAMLLRENEQRSAALAALALKQQSAANGHVPPPVPPPVTLPPAPTGIRATLDARAATLEEEIAQLERQMARVRSSKAA